MCFAVDKPLKEGIGRKIYSEQNQKPCRNLILDSFRYMYIGIIWFYHCLLQLYYCTTTAEVLHDFLKSSHLFVDMLPAKLYFIQTDFKVLIQGFKGLYDNENTYIVLLLFFSYHMNYI